MLSKMYLIGDVDEESFKEFSKELAEYEENGVEVIDLEINSQGGNAIDALAYYSRITNSPLVFNAIVYGLVASAAVLVFAACDKRIMTMESWLMVHEDTDTAKNFHTSQVEKQAKHLRRLENQWCALLETRSKTSKEEWARLHKEDIYLTPNECLKLGIVDEII